MGKLSKISKQLSYLLRHDSEDLSMDKYGYVPVDDILTKVSITLDELNSIVEDDNKNRFNIKDNKICARQGHTLNVKIEKYVIKNPKVYYHGTSKDNLKSILKYGLKSMQRQYVHLSDDINTAKNVGLRYAKKNHNLVILKVDGFRMKVDGFILYKSTNDVILTEKVLPKYIEIYE